MKSRRAPVNPVESAIRSDTIRHLAQLCVRLGRPIDWDPVTETATDPFVHALLDRPQRVAPLAAADVGDSQPGEYR